MRDDPQADGRAGDAPLRTYLQGLVDAVRDLKGGAVATYIPELGKAPPDRLGIAVTTVDGRTQAAGDAGDRVTIQSVSKPFLYGLALAERGHDAMRARVGVEPTGERFNAILLDEVHNRPFNPMVNAGAIAVAAALTGPDRERNAERMLATLSALAGRRLDIDAAVWRSETETGHRNRAIAWLMMNSGMIEADPDDALDLYFRQCSVLVDCRDLSVMAATLAAGGVNPLTGTRVFSAEITRDVLSVMATCGMYDYAGQWLFEVGLPAKSGVSGLICAVVPGQFGLAAYSPRLDAVGNSVRGVAMCKRFAGDFGLHCLTPLLDPGAVIRRDYTGTSATSNRQRSAADSAFLQARGMALRVIELQGPLHFAAAERIVQRVGVPDPGCETLVLDFRHAGAVDAAALGMLEELAARTGAAGIRLCCTGLGRLPEAEATRLGAGLGRVATLHDDLDHAVEAHEDRVLARHGRPSPGGVLPVAQLEIFAGLAPADLHRLEAVASMFAFEPGAAIITAGEAARAFFVVARGRVDILVDRPDGPRRRVSSVGPGQAFGDMALLDGGVRSAYAVARDAALCYVFSMDGLREVARDSPAVMEAIYRNLIASLSIRLRKANDQIITLD